MWHIISTHKSSMFIGFLSSTIFAGYNVGAGGAADDAHTYCMGMVKNSWSKNSPSQFQPKRRQGPESSSKINWI